ncbi:MAG: ABC transporter permease [Clostridiales bacterium]|nr:ABC transporter permease [Clostridiales bacterium]
MQEFLRQIMPNVMSKPDILWRSMTDTLAMLGWSGSLSFLIGLILGVALIVTKKGGVMENGVLYQTLDKVINFFRSIPFIILLAGLIPLTRIMMGTAIGVRGAVVPLVFGATPFFARQIESALSELDGGVIEAAQSMGSSPLEIILRVYLKECIASIARATSIMTVTLIELTAMAGAVGAGGLGDFAIRYGHQRNQIDVTYVTVIILTLLVSVIQMTGTVIARKNTH